MKAEPQAKLLFALTSPSLCNVQGDGSVVTLNNQAAAIMAKYNVSGTAWIYAIHLPAHTLPSWPRTRYRRSTCTTPS